MPKRKSHPSIKNTTNKKSRKKNVLYTKEKQTLIESNKNKYNKP